MERQMDWVTTGHKREAGTKWTAPIMLRLLEGNKSQWKTHLKAPLLSSLIPAGGLASTKPLAKRVREGAIKCWPEYWCKMCPEKKTTECVNRLCCWGSFQRNTIQGCVELLLLLSGPPSEHAERLRGSRGSGGASRQARWHSERSGYIERGVQKLVKMPPSRNCEYPQHPPPPCPPHPRLSTRFKALRRLRATGGHEVDERGNTGSRFSLMCRFDRNATLQQKTEKREIQEREGRGQGRWERRQIGRVSQRESQRTFHV